MPRFATLAGIAGDPYLRGAARNGVVVSFDAVRLRQLGVDPSQLTNAIATARMVEFLGAERLGASEPQRRRCATRRAPSRTSVALPITGPRGVVFRLDELAAIRPEEDPRGGSTASTAFTAVTARSTAWPVPMRSRPPRRARAMAAEVGTGASTRASDSSSPATPARTWSSSSTTCCSGVGSRSGPWHWCCSSRSAMSRVAALVLGSARRDRRHRPRALPAEDPRQPADPCRPRHGHRHPGAERAGRGRTAPHRAGHPDGRAEPGRRSPPPCSARRSPPASCSSRSSTSRETPARRSSRSRRRSRSRSARRSASLAGDVPAVGAGHGVARGGWPRLARAYDWVLIKLLRWRWVTVTLTTAAGRPDLGLHHQGAALELGRLVRPADHAQRLARLPAGSDPGQPRPPDAGVRATRGRSSWGRAGA